MPNYTDPSTGLSVVTRIQPRPTQFDGLNWLSRRNFGLVGWEMGCGKTKLALDLTQIRDDIKRLLIVCPKSVIPVWPMEVKTHMEGREAQVYTARKGDTRAKAIGAHNFLKSGFPGLKIVVVNYDTIWREPFATWAVNHAMFNAMFCDESHRAKAPTGKSSLFLYRLGKVVPFRYLLTGTPMPHSPLDIFGQFRVMNIAVLGGSYRAFETEYGIKASWNEHHIVGYRNLDKLNALIDPHIHRVMCRDVLDLPPQMHRYIEFDMSASTERTYRAMEEDFIAQVKDNVITASNAMVAVLRLQQITSGVANDENKKAVVIGDDKIKVFSDCLEDIPNDESIVVFAKFKSDVARAKEVLQRWVPKGTHVGEQSGQSDDWVAFKNGDFHSIVVNIQSGGAGIDLTRANHCFYFSQTHSLGQYDQSLKRVHRPGQTKPVTYYHLVARNSVDENIYTALEKRAKIVAGTLGDNILEDILEMYRRK